MSAGMRQYVRELVARLPQVAPDFEFLTLTRGGNFGWDEQVSLPCSIARSRADLVHFLSVYTPLVSPATSILTIHDLIHLLYPEQFKKSVGPYYRTAVRRACARAARVITDDERTVKELQRFLNVNPEKVRVVPLGVNFEGLAMTNMKTTRERKYFLYVGNHRVHKSIDTLLEAWKALPANFDVNLLLTGPDDFDGALQRASTERRQATALGDISREELTARYRGAAALVHPALREGFGLPMLEAMAAGTPVIACADAVPRALEPAVATFPPKNVGMLTARLMEILSDQALRERLAGEGREIAKRLTWDHCAVETANVYREILA
jgi:glycosyltransferase involved in cell wall biosynthesis